ncbi:MAG TPA: hypothetical protein PKD54_00065 [Pirellulaceae bacterium]|mgnify:CR=1 FL=1|nr:hypothetical protein [Pirellulaceae bacterium]
MSRPSSDAEVLVDSGELAQPPTMLAESGTPAAAQPRQRRIVVGKQPFSIYTVFLIVSLVFLTTASIILFVTANNI